MIRFALFGAGRAGRIHAENIARHPAAELAVVCDIDCAAAEPLAERHGARATSDPASVRVAARFADSGIRHERFPEFHGEASFAGLLDSFVTALESGQPVEPSLREALQAHLVAEAAVESLYGNRPVSIAY